MGGHDSTDSLSAFDVAALFENPKADVILRSSDSVDYRCYKVLLALASTVFEGMFELPQPPQGEGDDVVEGGLHVVLLHEDSQILEPLLRMCHPSSLNNPPFLELDSIKSIVEASRKYEMDEVEKYVRKELISTRFLETEPMRVYAIACLLKAPDEMRVASTATLAFDRDELGYAPELALVSGADYYHLLEYHKACGNAARDAACRFSWLRRYRTRDQFAWDADCDDSCQCAQVDIPGYGTGAKWWMLSYIDPCKEALARKPVGKTVKGDKVMDAALKGASSCPQCASRCLPDLREFSAEFADEVDKVVAKVCLDSRDKKLHP